MIRFIQQHLFGVVLLLSVGLHGAAAFLGHATESPKLKPVQAGRASISLRSSVSAGPKNAEQVAKVEPKKVEPKPVPKPKPPEPKAAPVRPVVKAAPAPPEKLPLPVPEEPKEKPKVDEPKAQEKKVAADPKKPLPQVEADQESPAARGSAGSTGAEADSLPSDSAFNRPPIYPPELLREGIQGKVVLQLKIDARGNVTSVRVYKSSEYEAFDQSAVQAAQAWVFEPARRGGVPIPYEILWNVKFIR